MKDTSANPGPKKLAGVGAAALVQSGMIVGLGTGSTAAFAIQELGRRVKEEGLLIKCTATSIGSMLLAHRAGLTMLPLSLIDHIDISIDGADEIDPKLNLIKGGGAAHTVEKLVHAMSERFVVVADASKRVTRLGEKFLVPVEVIPSAVSYITRALAKAGARESAVRMAVKKDGPVITENGNLVVDARFEIADPAELETRLNSIPGVLDNGIFSRVSVRVSEALIATETSVEKVTA